MKLRLKRIEKAKNRIEKLQERIRSTNNELSVCQEGIDETRSEVGYRELL